MDIPDLWHLIQRPMLVEEPPSLEVSLRREPETWGPRNNGILALGQEARAISRLLVFFNLHLCFFLEEMHQDPIRKVSSRSFLPPRPVRPGDRCRGR